MVVGTATAATVSGTIAHPVSDNGDRPQIYGSRVRVEGTDVSTAVVALDHYTGTFQLTDVPLGAVTLLLEEPLQGAQPRDAFTHSSKRVELTLSGDATGITFDLQYHWQNLKGYPAPWGTTGYTGEWTPHFVSADVGFILFRIRGTGIDPERVELWRTTNGGTDWSMIGQWRVNVDEIIPDRVGGRLLHFTDANTGVVQAQIDTNADPSVFWYATAGVLRTVNGGATWEFVDFDNPPEAGVSAQIRIDRMATIDATRWIACGANAGSVGYTTIWESADTAATWQVAHYAADGQAVCTALGADPSGRAIMFSTPYPFGGVKTLMLRNTSGNWTSQTGNQLVTNSGYGPADVPMIGGTAWVTGSLYEGASALETGLFRTDDYGATWSRISTSLVQYHDFGTLLKGFATAGGPAYASYDGGVTWRFQMQGGGVCCHGNNVFAFGKDRAIWQDGGVGDPNGTSDIFTYVEPADANFEVLTAATVAGSTVLNGTVNVPIAGYRLQSHGSVPVQLASLTLEAAGTGNDRDEVLAVKVWHDADANGVVSGGDTMLGSSVYSADNGSATVNLGGLVLEELAVEHLLVTYNFSTSVPGVRTYRAGLSSESVVGQALHAGGPLPIAAVAPTGTEIAGPEVTVLPPASSVTLTPSPASPALVGTSVTFTAAASGGSGTYEYMFLLRPPGGALSPVQAYSTTPTWNWNTSGAMAGTYQIVVRARNAGSAAGYETYTVITYGLNSP